MQSEPLERIYGYFLSVVPVASSGGLPYLGKVYIEREKPLQLKLHKVASTLPKNHTQHKRNYNRVHVRNFY